VTRSRLYTILTFSLLLNAAVLLTVAYRVLAPALLPGMARSASQEPGYLTDTLDLSEAQRAPWRAKARTFSTEVDGLWEQVAQRRERMIRAVFSPNPDAAVVEAERAAIARLQVEIQQRVIAHMREERELLTDAQRQRLAELLVVHSNRASDLNKPQHGD